MGDRDGDGVERRTQDDGRCVIGTAFELLDHVGALEERDCRVAAKFDQNRRAILTKLRRVAEACQSLPPVNPSTATVTSVNTSTRKEKAYTTSCAPPQTGPPQAHNWCSKITGSHR